MGRKGDMEDTLLLALWIIICLTGLGLILCIITILTPFFVNRIRIEMVELNKKANIAIELLSKQLSPEPPEPPNKNKIKSFSFFSRYVKYYRNYLK